MKIHTLIQGSPEWLAYRSQHFNASDAPAMLGLSPYKSRVDLLREMHSGVAAEVDTGTQRRFDNGHRAEALARPLAEEFLGQEFFPAVGSEGRLSASFDGITLDDRIVFEHKALNNELRRAIQDENSGPQLPIYHRVQMEQQLLVSGAERVLFMASQWDADENLIEERHCWYRPDLKLRAQIVAGWEQFEKDLAAYAPKPAAAAAPTGKKPETLPALHIEVTGKVTASNLAEFKETALAAIRSVNRELTTDQHFADAEKAVKWCADIEARLESAKNHALSQTASIDALFKAIDDISAEASRTRLDLDKLVTRRKTEVKDEAVIRVRTALAQHITALNAELAPYCLQPLLVDFAAAIKGKRSFDSMNEALELTLASAKIGADAQARDIRKNAQVLRETGAGFEFLFADAAQLVHKSPIDFEPLVKGRIDAHKVAEAAKAEERRKREEAEAEQRRQREEAAAAAQREREAQAAEAKRIQAENDAAEALRTSLVAPAAAPAVVAAAPTVTPVRIAPPPAPAPRPDEQPTLKLGAICDRLGFSMTSAFLATLGIPPARADGASKLYRESDFHRICQALVQHIEHAQHQALQPAAA